MSATERGMSSSELDIVDYYDLGEFGGGVSFRRNSLGSGSRALSVQRTPPCQCSATLFYNYLA